MDSPTQLPERLATIVELFASAPRELKLEALLDFSRKLRPLPADLAEDRSRLKAVPECQTPFFLAVEDGGEEGLRLHFDAPPESPTVRGFAGILQSGLDGLSAREIASVPQDFYRRMGLEEAVSVLRLRGMSAILARLQHIVRSEYDLG